MGFDAAGRESAEVSTREAGRFDIDTDLLCVANAEGRFVSMNAAWERLLGWSREELQARPFIEFVHPDDVARTIEAAADIGRPDAEIPDFVNRYRTRDGDYRWLRWSARSNGEAWFAVASDVTDQHQRQEDLRRILREDRLLAYSQPILDQRLNRISHRELLVRLRTGVPGDELIQPSGFVPEAERFGLIGMVDRWMLRKALTAAASGRPTTVNVSARSIDDPAVLAEVCEIVEAAPQGAANLIFEITESAALEHIDAALELTRRLEPLGCSFALDDFGTGFGSLTYLRFLPVQFLKIDTTFVRHLVSNRADQALVRSVIAIAAELGLSTVAEGVEDPATFQLLRDYGVDHVQGYLIGRPEPMLA